MLSFKPAFSLYLFTLIKRLFSSSLLSIIRMVSQAYLRLLIFLPAILIQACASSSLAFLMMYFAYKLSKQGDSIQPNKDHGIWSHHLVANRETMQMVTDFIFSGSKITVDGNCSHEIKRRCSLEEKQ